MTSSSNQSDQQGSMNVNQNEFKDLKRSIDTFFLVIMGVIIFFLQAGFAFYESGTVRSKNVTSVLFRNYMNTCISCLAYLVSGYALAFGNGNGFCGVCYFALVDLPVEKMAYCFFQYTFAAVSVTIISASLHERCSMTAFFSYTILFAGFTYPIVSHWAWSPYGWLSQMGFQDFAGSAVVHATGGAGALAATIMVGPRLGRFERNGEMNSIQPHSIPQAALGAFIFLFGCIAFNAGSNLTISKPGDGAIISRIVINTMICVASSTVTALFYQRFLTASGRTLKNWSFMNMLNGSFAGMVVVCGGCDRYPPWGAFVVGCLSYFAFLLGIKAMHRFQIDDTTNSVPVQLGPGYLGVLCSAIFSYNGVILNPSKSSAFVLLMNVIGGAVMIVWSFSTTLMLYLVLRFLNVHRATSREENIGLDMAVHNQSAYNMEDRIERIEYSTESMSILAVSEIKPKNNSNRTTAKVQPSPSGVPFGLRRMVSEPHIHAW